MNNIYSGNINFPLTPFVFDRIYENRNVPTPEELLANDDGVYVGRYVLEKRDASGQYNRVFQKRSVDNKLCYVLVANYDAPEETIKWEFF